jgi:hypothetical protein
VGSPPSSIGLDFTNGSHSATASNRRIVAHTFSAGASTTLLTRIRGISQTYCEATVRVLVSSFSKSMLLVSSSGKTIGSSFFPGYST